MNVSIALVSAALEGDKLARAQLNDLFEEYQLPKLKFTWRHQELYSRCLVLSKFGFIVDVNFNKDLNKWELDCPLNHFPYRNFDSREEAIEFFEKDFLRDLYNDS
jgi:hypothetical protein